MPISRGARPGWIMLDSVDKAPANVIQRERDGLAGAQAMAERLRERLAQLGRAYKST